MICENNRGLALLRSVYKVFPNLLLCLLISYAEEVVEIKQCGIGLGESAIDQPKDTVGSFNIER